MAHRLSVLVTAPFTLEDLMARVECEGGSVCGLVLRRGRFQGELPQRPLRLVLSLDPPPTSERTVPGDSASVSCRHGAPVAVPQLFEHGVAIPADGVLEVQVSWGAPCHEERVFEETDTRFGTWEHMLTAAHVGLDGDRNPPRACGVTLDERTLLTVGAKALKFGEIVALAGDFYAHLDPESAQAFAWAWPAAEGLAGWLGGDYRDATLLDAGADETRALLRIAYRDRDATRSAADELFQLTGDTLGSDFSARRYLALASQNFCHFGSQPADGTFDEEANETLKLYRAYHRRALKLAAEASRAMDREAAFHRALVTDAFACHFLTDAFATGHIRVPRRVLGERFGVLKGSLRMCHAMHAEDNELGLWCRPWQGNGRTVWRAFGDGRLRTPPAGRHLEQVREAVRRSVAEVFAAASDEETLVEDPAEALVPVPLAAGARPGVIDVWPDGVALCQEALAEAMPNHFPLYAVLPDGRVVERLGPPGENRYRVVGERTELVLGAA